MSADYVIQFGKKYKGKKLGDIPDAEIQNYMEWLLQSDLRVGSPLHKQAMDLKQVVDAYMDAKKAAVATQEKEAPEVGKVSGRKKTVNKNDPYRGANVNGNVARLFITENGDELPLINLKGKEYLEVKYRLVWFRSERPDWTIETEYLTITDKSAHAKAVIKDQSGRTLVTSHKFENAQGFADFLEKAETGAIGRALALLGYGTQFCADELDEGERVVDSPVGHGQHPSEPVVPKIENGPVISIKLPKRNKPDEEKLRQSGFTFDWATHCYLRYYDDNFDVDALGFEYEVLEQPAFKE